jgi:hypothetical protein
MNNNLYNENLEQILIKQDSLVYEDLKTYLFNYLFPSPNTPYGLLFYCFIVFIIRNFFLFFCKYYIDKLNDQEIGINKSFSEKIYKKILEKRKIKAKEALDILKKIN